MSKYENLTKYIPLMHDDGFGEWIVDTQSAGTREDPIQMPFVDYSRMVHQFVEDVYSYYDDTSEVDYTGYCQLLEDRGININGIQTSDVDISNADAIGIVALLVAVVRGERFCDGLILGAFKDGSIMKWLQRLKELDCE